MPVRDACCSFAAGSGRPGPQVCIRCSPAAPVIHGARLAQNREVARPVTAPPDRVLSSLTLMHDGAAVIGCRFDSQPDPVGSRARPRYALQVSPHSAPWAGVVRSQFEQLSRQTGVDLSPALHLLMTSLAPGTYASYGSKFFRFVQFCAASQLCPLPASSAAVVAYAVHLAEEGSVQASSAQPYFSAINRVHRDVFPDRAPPARDDHLLSAVRRGWERAQVSLAPSNVRSLFPAQVVAHIVHLGLSLPGSQVPLLRACAGVVFDYITFVRSATGMLLPVASVQLDVAALTLSYRPATLKTALVSEQSSRPVHIDLSGMPAVAELLGRYVALSAAARQGSSVLAPRQWFL